MSLLGWQLRLNSLEKKCFRDCSYKGTRVSLFCFVFFKLRLIVSTLFSCKKVYLYFTNYIEQVGDIKNNFSVHKNKPICILHSGICTQPLSFSLLWCFLQFGL